MQISLQHFWKGFISDSYTKDPPSTVGETQMRFIFSALNALQPAKKLELNFPQMIWSYGFSSEIHSIVALGKMVKYIVTLLFGCSTSIFFSKKNNNKVVVIRLLVVNLG
jgi:hypothetical protein